MNNGNLDKKKILYLVKTLSVGGAERFTFNLCNFFVNIFSEVTVFSSGGIFSDEFKKTGVKIYNSPIAAKTGIKNFFLLKRELSLFLEKNHFDIIHCQHRHFVPIVNSLKLKNTKIVYTANNYFNDFYQKLIKADAIVGISPTIVDNLLDTRKTQKEKIVLINYGVTEIVKRHIQNEFCIGYVGRLIKEKGIFELLKAIKILRTIFPNIKLVIRGEGKDKNDILKYIIKYELQNHVEIKDGTIKHEEIYEEINVIILPSKIKEGLPISILECLINKIVVITTPQGAVKDLIKDGHTGFLLDAPKTKTIVRKLEHVFNNIDRLEELKNNAYQLVKEKYSLKNMLEDYHTLYSKLV